MNTVFLVSPEKELVIFCSKKKEVLLKMSRKTTRMRLHFLLAECFASHNVNNSSQAEVLDGLPTIPVTSKVEVFGSNPNQALKLIEKIIVAIVALLNLIG